MKLCWIVIFCLCYHKSLAVYDWTYSGANGPKYWHSNYPLCAGQLQSPINFNISNMTYRVFEDFNFTNYDTDIQTSEMTLSNDGRGATVYIGTNDIYISGGDLPSALYRLVEMKFHWGSTNSKGSEHTVDETSFPAELHLVHYNTKYISYSEALNHDDGLAILGIFMEVNDFKNEGFQSIVDGLCSVRYAGETYTQVSPFQLNSFIPPDTDQFTRYEGSLTQPPCNEAVVYSNFKNPAYMSQTQLNTLRSLSRTSSDDQESIPIIDNYRPVQPVNDRIIYRSYLDHTKPVDDSSKTMVQLLPISLMCLFAVYIY